MAFACDAAMQLGAIDDEFASRLACDTSALLGTGWQTFLHQPDPWMVRRLETDKRAGRGGTYAMTFAGWEGHRFRVVVRTLAVHAPDAIRMTGTIEERDVTSPRRHFDLGRRPRRAATGRVRR